MEKAEESGRPGRGWALALRTALVLGALPMSTDMLLAQTPRASVDYRVERSGRVAGQETIRHSPAPFPAQGQHVLSSESRTLFSGGRMRMTRVEMRVDGEWRPAEIQVARSLEDGGAISLHGGFVSGGYRISFSSPTTSDSREFMIRPPTFLMDHEHPLLYLQNIIFAHRSTEGAPHRITTIGVFGSATATGSLDFAGHRVLGETEEQDGDNEQRVVGPEYELWRFQSGRMSLTLWVSDDGTIRRVEDKSSGLVIRAGALPY